MTRTILSRDQERTGSLCVARRQALPAAFFRFAVARHTLQHFLPPSAFLLGF